MRVLALVCLLSCAEPAPRAAAPSRAEPTAPPPASEAAGTEFLNNRGPSPSLNTPAEPRESEHGGIWFTELPTGGAQHEDRLPLVIALHGMGGDDASFAHAFSDLPLRMRIAAARGEPRRTGGYGWLPTPAPGNPEARARPIRETAARLEGAIVALMQARPTCGEPIAIGFSQGAMITFGLGASETPVIGAAYPISGYLPVSLVRRDTAERPRIVALHGEVDRVVPIGHARRAIEALSRAGYSAELRSYPETDHEISPAMASDLVELLRAHLCE